MKVKDTQRFIQCDNCGKREPIPEDEGGFRQPLRSNTFITLSLLGNNGKREFFDFCSLPCLRDFVNK